MFLPSKSMGLGRRWSSLCRRLWLTPVPGWRSLSNQTQTQILNPQQQPQREELPREKAIPWLMLSSPSDPQNRHLYELTADDSRIKPRKVVELPDIAGHFCFGSSQGYIFTIPPLEQALHPEICATNPLTGRPLPVPSVNLLSAHPLPWHSYPRNKIRYYPLFLGRTLLSPSLDYLYLLRDGVLDIAKLEPRPQWIQHNFCHMRTSDCVLYKGHLYAVRNKGELLIFDPGNPLAPPIFIDNELQLKPNDQRYFEKYLALSPDGEDLFLLCRGRQMFEMLVWRTNLFKVFKLHKDKGGRYKWNQMNSLDGLALFVGVNESLSCYANDFAHILKPNCIYFTDDDRKFYWQKEYNSGDTGVFSLEENKAEYYEMDGEDLIFDGPPPVWLVPAAD